MRPWTPIPDEELQEIIAETEISDWGGPCTEDIYSMARELELLRKQAQLTKSLNKVANE